MSALNKKIRKFSTQLFFKIKNIDDPTSYDLEKSEEINAKCRFLNDMRGKGWLFIKGSLNTTKEIGKLTITARFIYVGRKTILKFPLSLELEKQ